jgi:cyclohexanone monooxygenase
VWNRGGCSSWYLDDEGRNTTLWPRATFTLRRELRAFDVRSYVVTGPRARPLDAPATPTPTREDTIPA